MKKVGFIGSWVSFQVEEDPIWDSMKLELMLFSNQIMCFFKTCFLPGVHFFVKFTNARLVAQGVDQAAADSMNIISFAAPTVELGKGGWVQPQKRVLSKENYMSFKYPYLP